MVIRLNLEKKNIYMIANTKICIIKICIIKLIAS